MIRMPALLGLFVWLVSASVIAAEFVPQGIFVCYGPRLNDKVLDKPFVSGLLVRQPWREIEPMEGRYDWSEMEAQVEAARARGKKVALALIAGPHTPDWVYAKGAEAYQYEFQNPWRPASRERQMQIPPPWDPVFLEVWKRTIKAFGDKFGGDSAVVLIHITGSSKNGLELQLPEESRRRLTSAGTVGEHERDGRWKAAGYTPDRFVDAWKRVIDAFGAAFPETALDLEVHPILGDNEIPRELAAYGVERLNGRFGLFGGWLSGRIQPWNAELNELMGEYAKKTFVDYQLIGNATRQPQRFGEGGMIGAIEAGIRQGARYFEVWEADVLNPAFEEQLEQIDRRLRTRAP